MTVDLSSLEPSKQEPYMTKGERNKVLGALRNVFAYSEWAKDFRLSHLSDTKGPRGGRQYICEVCGELFPANKTEVHHIDPVVPVGKKSSDLTFDQIVSRLWCDKKNLMLVCKDCHKHETDKQRNERKSKNG